MTRIIRDWWAIQSNKWMLILLLSIYAYWGCLAFWAYSVKGFAAFA